ncbi:class I SAM-dependent methyltransferase [Haloimpatiens massiliensis]|uniref:class I SAM-dependent methyltransferase n=1 Tax=Haloimpatiens massiliensis TaxID=1658110 RepID=UPI000C817FF9|nr:class I SAM-dependent methyltransferase [Haloimpatiens massiliensis]
MTEVEELIRERWENSAEGYSSFIERELEDLTKEKWRKYIIEDNSNSPLKILDLGTGPGYFSIILSEVGHDVTGVDIAEQMVQVASRNAKKVNVSPKFRVMDNHKLEFEDNTFDILVCRNVTWTLERPKEAYKEWYRVIKPQGKLIIFDANWHLHEYDEELHKIYLADVEEHDKLYPKIIHSYRGKNPEAKSYYKRLPLSRIVRPNWDMKALREIGFSEVITNTNINKDVYLESDQLLYRSIPMFRICAMK